MKINISSLLLQKVSCKKNSDLPENSISTARQIKFSKALLVIKASWALE